MNFLKRIFGNGGNDRIGGPPDSPREIAILAYAERQMRETRKQMPGWEPFDAKSFQDAASRLGIILPDTWLRALPFLFEVVGSPQLGESHDCNLNVDAEQFERCNSGRRADGKDVWDSKRWVEIGGDCSEGSFFLDLESESMPKDARVVFQEVDFDDSRREWASVVDFVAEVTGYPA